MLVNTHAGGWSPHKDNPQLTRSTFRIVAFLSRVNLNMMLMNGKWQDRSGPIYNFAKYIM